MAANTVTCADGTAAAVTTDTVFSITKTVQNPSNGINFLLNFTVGTSGKLTLTYETADESVGATTFYKVLSSGIGSSTAALSHEFTATGLYKIPIPLSPNDSALKITLTFQTTGGTGIVVGKFAEY